MCDPESDRAFVEELKQRAVNVEVREVDLYINTPEFAREVIQALEEILPPR